ncbi:ShlA/HecA/FhaA exofamily protein [Xenorhabdus vietnamensis]|uniref:ShlA/HecA/FhaA exofamily protein n=1 Tax=Xenorhabdus vietnamensis TaxID=351656 RepID=A0A1Y2SB18_9GAMM|nr:hypothetical protein [Xenorhabdus vietnamensis]OTA14928.1 ShlA/HecA/FhaA exofamily protein [Xenorhabdus vietnamensis]
MKKLFVIILAIFYAIFVPLSQASEVVKYPQQDQQNKTTERKKRSVLTLPLKVCKRIAYCRTKLAKKLLEIAAKVGIVGISAKGIADNISQEDFDHLITLLMIGNDEITQRYLNELQEKYGSGKSAKPNIGKGLTADQKAKLGGVSSGTPGGWEPQGNKHVWNNKAVRQQQKNRFEELRRIFDKNDPSRDLMIDGKIIRQGQASNSYGTTKVYESQGLINQQIYRYAQQLAGNTPLKEVRPGIYTAKTVDGTLITLRNVSSSNTGARWTIDIRGNQRLSELGHKYKDIEIKFR